MVLVLELALLTRLQPLLDGRGGGGSSSSSSSGGEHVIGAPFDVNHVHGGSKVMSNLVSHEEAQRRQTAGGGDVAPSRAVAAAPAASTPAARVAPPVPAAPGRMRFKLIADVRDIGEGVLTGARLGEQVEILQVDWAKKGDWCWATIGSRQGWVPVNHLQQQ